MPDGLGNSEQVRLIADQVGLAAASAAVREFVSTHPHFAPPPKAEIPAPIKIAAGILTALMTAAVIALSFWVVTTLNELQLTVTRIDERQQQDDSKQRVDSLEKRVLVLEQGKPT